MKVTDPDRQPEGTQLGVRYSGVEGDLERRQHPRGGNDAFCQAAHPTLDVPPVRQPGMANANAEKQDATAVDVQAVFTGITLPAPFPEGRQHGLRLLQRGIGLTVQSFRYDFPIGSFFFRCLFKMNKIPEPDQEVEGLNPSWPTNRFRGLSGNG